jgi:hypothetical protein
VNELIEVLKTLPVGGLSFGGLVTLAIILIFKGEIIPKSTHDSMRANYDAIISSKDDQITMLKEAYVLSEKARISSVEDNQELLEIGRTTIHLLESINARAKQSEVSS